MAGRHRGRGYISGDDNSLESTANSQPPPRSYRPQRRPGTGKPRSYTRGLNQHYSWDFNGDEEDEEEGEDEFRAGEGTDNPLYEVEDEESRFPPPAPPRQASPNNNPLYGNDPFKAPTTAAVCMTAFLKPKASSPKGSPQCSQYGLRVRPKRPPQFDEFGNFIPMDKEEAPGSSSRLSPDFRSPRPTGGMGIFRRARGDQSIIRYPPARFSPLAPAASPDSGQLVSSPKGKRIKQSQPVTTPGPLPKTPPPNIGDLIAAVRSDKNLLLGEVRKYANREPRVPGDHDRYFSPRKGDIIVHFNPTLEHNKLLEYYDAKKTILTLQPGDKLVRVKYDNYKLPDHLMITSKLYLYAPEWVYLGKALQTIKTV